MDKSIKSIVEIEALMGPTKLHQLNYDFGNLYTKLEYQNIFGSIKDRPAYYILKKAIENELINDDTTIIESSSGNFAIALSSICKVLGLKFIAVIDPNISKEKEKLLILNGSDFIRVTERDETGGYLLNRIKKVKEFVASNINSYTPNQYENPDNYLAYYYTLGEEICNSFSRLDYAFISVSTGGTITGLSRRLKEKFKDIIIIGVDVEGSFVFNNEPAIRQLSGIGASKRTVLFNDALIDDHIILSQSEIIQGCNQLKSEHNLFLGASSGAAYAASDKILKKINKKSINALFISPDSGHSYLDTIYDQSWVLNNIIKSDKYDIFK